MSIRVALQRDDASARVHAVHDLLTTAEGKRGLMEVVGMRAGIELKNWFARRDAESPNKMGWPQQHFWLRIRSATAYDPSRTTDTTATVVVADPALAAKVNGATIKPTQGRKALAIPMNAEAYAVGSPGDPASSRIPGLFVFRSAAGGAFLVRKEGSGPGANLTFYYRLMPQVTVPKDPQALPPVEQLGAALSATADSFYRRHLETNGQNA